MPRKVGRRTTAEIIVKPKGGGVRLILDAVNLGAPEGADDPKGIVKAFGGRIDLDDVYESAVLQGGGRKGKGKQIQVSKGKKVKGKGKN